MADEKRTNIKPDEIVDRVLRLEKTPGGVIKLVGRFLGNSTREDHYRLYLTEELNHYYEFPKDATLEAERFPSGRMVVWVKAGTHIEDIFAKVASEDFLRGSIHSTHARRVASGMRGAMMVADAAASGCMGSCPQSDIA